MQHLMLSNSQTTPGINTTMHCATNTTSNLEAGGGINITATGRLTAQGSQIAAKAHTNLSAAEVLISAVQDVYSQEKIKSVNGGGNDLDGQSGAEIRKSGHTTTKYASVEGAEVRITATKKDLNLTSVELTGETVNLSAEAGKVVLGALKDSKWKNKTRQTSSALTQRSKTTTSLYESTQMSKVNGKLTVDAQEVEVAIDKDLYDQAHQQAQTAKAAPASPLTAHAQGALEVATQTAWPDGTDYITQLLADGATGKRIDETEHKRTRKSTSLTPEAVMAIQIGATLASGGIMGGIGSGVQGAMLTAAARSVTSTAIASALSSSIIGNNLEVAIKDGYQTLDDGKTYKDALMASMKAGIKTQVYMNSDWKLEESAVDRSTRKLVHSAIDSIVDMSGGEPIGTEVILEDLFFKMGTMALGEAAREATALVIDEETTTPERAHWIKDPTDRRIIDTVIPLGIEDINIKDVLHEDYDTKCSRITGCKDLEDQPNNK